MKITKLIAIVLVVLASMSVLTFAEEKGSDLSTETYKASLAKNMSEEDAKKEASEVQKANEAGALVGEAAAAKGVELGKRAVENGQKIGEEAGKAGVLMGENIAKDAANKGKEIAEQAKAMNISEEDAKNIVKAALKDHKELLKAIFNEQNIDLDAVMTQNQNETKNLRVRLTPEKFVAGDVEIDSNDKDMKVTANNVKINVAQKNGKVVIKDQGVEVSTEGVTLENGSISVNDKKIMLPSELFANKNGKITHAALSNEGDMPIYTINKEVDAKLFGFISKKMAQTETVDAVTGETKAKKSPWWSFLATE